MFEVESKSMWIFVHAECVIMDCIHHWCRKKQWYLWSVIQWNLLWRL